MKGGSFFKKQKSNQGKIKGDIASEKESIINRISIIYYHFDDRFRRA